LNILDCVEPGSGIPLHLSLRKRNRHLAIPHQPRSHNAMYELREKPLDVCPDLICRRTGLCHSTALSQPCRKFYMDDDEWRNQLASYLEALYIEWTGDPYALQKPLPECTPEGLAELRNALLEREAEIDAEKAAGRSRGR
jgi:hypothetical protein